jgi:hypothetical protein
LFGLDNSSKKNDIFLIDFGLCTEYLNKDGTHIARHQTGHFIGNYTFCSLNTCRTYTKSRRDDFESIFYVLAYLLNKFRLPWTGLMGNNCNSPEMMTRALNDRL